jgi:hypothetical protein
LTVLNVMNTASDPGSANRPAKEEGVVLVIFDEQDYLNLFVHPSDPRRLESNMQSTYGRKNT